MKLQMSWKGIQASFCVATCVATTTLIVAGSAWAGSPTEAVLYNFGQNYSNPQYSLVADSAGNLYGTTLDGNLSAGGAVFALSPGTSGWTETTLLTFDGSNGSFPSGPLVLDGKGNLYGTTYYGGVGTCTNGSVTGCGVVFELSPGSGGVWTETILYEFKGGNDGAAPSGNLVFDPAGNFYGTAGGGGTGCGGNGCGLVFRLKPPAQLGGVWTKSVLHRFSGTDGSAPDNLMIKNGALYGTAFRDGAYSAGLVYELKPVNGQWTETVIYNFQGSPDGSNPQGVIAGGKNMYGTTVAGGLYGWGAVFELQPLSGGGWTESVLYSFTGSSDGANPISPPTPDATGDLFGTTYTGGLTSECNWQNPSDGCGVMYKLTPPAVAGGAWTETVVHAFSDTAHDGNLPSSSGVVFGKGGMLYGTTEFGGTGGCVSYLGNTVGCGTVYELVP